jgi:hypothetical protein|tara:strand:+ start:4047 stop:4211 length:165 start_codon:yes stop_codon:yes gene_type:complete
MAKLNESMIVIKVSELLKDDQEAHPILEADTINSIEAVVQELVGLGKLVEIIRE